MARDSVLPSSKVELVLGLLRFEHPQLGLDVREPGQKGRLLLAQVRELLVSRLNDLPLGLQDLLLLLERVGRVVVMIQVLAPGRP